MFASLLMLAQAAAQPSPMPAFMTGCWIMQSGERAAEECWTASNGGLMMGSGRAWAGEKIDNWELMRIERGEDGRLTFFASPKGVPQTGFRAVSATATDVVFENRAHDFPQRVRYWKTDDGVSAEIAKADGSSPVRYDFRRMGAPSPKAK
ncbi:MAG: DUF6265 family protein [Sphingomicrobium sp.]